MNYYDRQGTIDGLRQLADLLETNPDLPVPYINNASFGVHDSFIPEGSDAATELARIARILPGPFAKVVDDGYYRLKGKLGALEVEVWGNRSEVCTRVVTGTREVTKVVPVETREVVETEEIVEWVCEPLLAKAVAS